MRKILIAYLKTSLLLRITVGFAAGAIVGTVLWLFGGNLSEVLLPYIAPFGTLLINLLKMIVIPVIFFSIISGAAQLSLQNFGRVGLKVIIWYLLTSFLAAILGASVALLVNPGSRTTLAGWEKMITSSGITPQTSGAATNLRSNFAQLILSMFQNPFEALATNNFLAIIVFSLLFGLALRRLIDLEQKQEHQNNLNFILTITTVLRDVVFKIVDWILEYSPIGVFALTLTNFSLYGKNIIGPYVSVVTGIISGILIMIGVIYPLLMKIFSRRNPYKIMQKMDDAILTAFITRSSAATLPVTFRTMQTHLKVKSELTSFSLPLGATINMDGVCIHLPMFAVLAANLFGIDMNLHNLIVLVITTVLASIGAGGVPGGSLMLLFVILQALGLNATQVSLIVALATGINPILDMFETANNVTGDMVCTYVVAQREGMITDN